MEKESVIGILHREKCSCVIAKGDSVTLCHRRGVLDLFDILKESPEVLPEAFVADKVIGKGAAALMVLGKVSGVYADVISKPALGLLEASGIQVDFKTCVPNIINRSGTGICPVEQLCADCSTAGECLPLIEEFLNKK